VTALEGMAPFTEISYAWFSVTLTEASFPIPFPICRSISCFSFLVTKVGIVLALFVS
jgi:hypothetical protein